jgi:eukaryotic translation initiation factor 2C
VKNLANGHRKKIKSFGSDSNSGTVSLEDKTISIKDYFKQRYNIDLKHPHLPCIDLGTANKAVNVPLELCRTELSHRQMKDKELAITSRVTAVDPDERLKNIRNWIKECELGQDPVLLGHNIKSEIEPINLNGRVIEPPDIEYANNGVVKSKDIGRKGCWMHHKLGLNSAVTVENWIFINLAGYVQPADIDAFIGALIDGGRKHNIKMKDPIDVLDYVNSCRIRETFRGLVERYKKIYLIVFIMEENSPAYKEVKTLGDLEYGVQTQCFKKKPREQLTFDEKKISNILLKINTKLGGCNFILSQRAEL